MANKILFSSNSDEWATPDDIYQRLDDEFSFNLDPCANDINHKCDTYFTAETDGLSHTWGGTEFSVIHLIAKLINGLKKHTGKADRTTHLLYCLYHQGQIPDTFTTSFITELRSDL